MFKPVKNKTKVKCLPPQSKPYYQSEKLYIVRELSGRQPCNNCPISESYGRWSANIWNHSAFTKLTHRKSLENLTFLHTGNPIKSPLPLVIPPHSTFSQNPPSSIKPHIRANTPTRTSKTPMKHEVTATPRFTNDA